MPPLPLPEGRAGVRDAASVARISRGTWKLHGELGAEVREGALEVQRAHGSPLEQCDQVQKIQKKRPYEHPEQWKEYSMGYKSVDLQVIIQFKSPDVS